MKKCNKCGETKDDFEFESSVYENTGKTHFDNGCSKCKCVKHRQHRSDYRLEWKYGITRAQWELILKSQDGKCKLCGEEITGRDIHTDHDHKTMVVRGLLCFKCNRALGQFKDDPERLERAANYVRHANALKELQGVF